MNTLICFIIRWVQHTLCTFRDSIKTLLPTTKLLRVVFYQSQWVSSTLLDLKFSIRLADDPSIVELATGAEVIEEGQKVPLRLDLARTVVAEGIYTTVLHDVRDFQRLNLGLWVLLPRVVVFLHFLSSGAQQAADRLIYWLVENKN